MAAENRIRDLGVRGSMRRALLLAVGVLALAGCGGGGSSGGSSGGTTLGMYDYYFQPTTLTGKAGETVTVKVENKGKVEHNLTVDGQSVDQDVKAGKSASVQVTIPQSGTVTFYCSYHRARGMTGKLQAGSSGGSNGY